MKCTHDVRMLRRLRPTNLLGHKSSFPIRSRGGWRAGKLVGVLSFLRKNKRVVAHHEEAGAPQGTA
ncbi:hypothetical protein M404DRAFT_999533 [Pisolithus tinctorius Marx 270]|uniref:Uncharacterized protein n=1 Tax=Pisolithus tinctorius Marx 270 TaxID=870435 RepID=A0A0C3K8C8_PISTI|nr:hypothetical protein M404DRAFT_999533 [Pisolithus tinctorius Marx 270]